MAAVHPPLPPMVLLEYSDVYDRTPILSRELRAKVIIHEQRKTETCIASAAAYYRIHPLILKGIFKQEGGDVGVISRNKNGTNDYGKGQINSVWFNEFALQGIRVSWQQLTFNNCFNIYTAAYIYTIHFRETGNVSKAIANYHSKTPVKGAAYLDKVFKHIKTMVQEDAS